MIQPRHYVFEIEDSYLSLITELRRKDNPTNYSDRVRELTTWLDYYSLIEPPRSDPQ